MTAVERLNTSSFEGMPAPVHTTGSQPAATQRSG
jgi:hypothetical protein